MSKFEYNLIDSTTGANILANDRLNRFLINNGFRRNKFIMDCIDKTSKGSMVFTTGIGSKNLLISAGVHGNELSSQIALLKIMDDLFNDKLRINCRLHIVPFLIPKNTMLNSRLYNSVDMNRYADKEGVTKNLLDYAKESNMDSLCDCHTTDPDKKPGCSSIFCSARPLIESVKIAKHICVNTNSRLITIGDAGRLMSGAIEDESNISGIPAVTSESISKSGFVDENAIKMTCKHVKYFIDYFDGLL